jgi:hypothetical protein
MEINDDLTSRETDILHNFIMSSTKTLQIGLGATENSHLRPRFPQTTLQFNLSYILRLSVDNMKSRLKFEKFLWDSLRDDIGEGRRCSTDRGIDTSWLLHSASLFSGITAIWRKFIVWGVSSTKCIMLCIISQELEMLIKVLSLITRGNRLLERDKLNVLLS